MADPPRYPHSGDGTAVGPDRGSPPRMPRWVKVSGIIVIVLALLVAMMFIRGGQHGWSPHARRLRWPGLILQRHSRRCPVPRWLSWSYTARGQPRIIMPPRLRKFALTAHLTFSVGWIGAVVAYLALGVSAVTGQDAQTVRPAWIAMELIGWFVIVPSALAPLRTGLVMSLGTPWGLFRHYWTLIALVLTILSTVVLLLHMPTVSSLADVAREADGAELGGLGGDLFHPGLGLVVLLVITVLNVYKPRGITRYGWRKQEVERRKRHEQRPVRVP